MNTRNRLLTLMLTLMLWSSPLHAQASKPRTQKPIPKPIPDEKVEPAVMPESSEEALRRVLTNLSEQIDHLAGEVKKMRQETERNSTLLELALLEERLTRLEDKLDNAMTTKANLDIQEVDIQRRQRNIQQELTLRGAAALRRDESEAALKQEFQRILDSIRAQQSTLQTRITDLQMQADRLRFRIETLRKKADRLELKNETPPDK